MRLNVARWFAPFLVVVIPATGLAGRSLDEPDSVKAVPRMVPAQKIDKALTDRALKEKCGGPTLRAAELQGMTCRLVVHRHLAAEIPVDTASNIGRRVGMARDALRAEQSIASFAPLSKKPGFDREQYDAQREACGAVVDAYDAIRALPPSIAPDARAEADKALSGDGNLFDAACNCVQSSIGLADGANASVDEKGTMQGQLTSRGCFLDRDKIKAERGGPDSKFTGDANLLAAQNTDEARLVDYAKARLVGVERCTEKGITNGRVTDKKKLKDCVCGEVSRFSFPKERGRKDITIVVPIRRRELGVEVVVSAPGKVTSCGPLVGPMMEK